MSQHTKLTLDKKILPLILPGFELATFRSRVLRSNRLASNKLYVVLLKTEACKAGTPQKDDWLVTGF